MELHWLLIKTTCIIVVVETTIWFFFKMSPFKVARDISTGANHMHSLTLKYFTSSRSVSWGLACKQINKNQKLMAEDKKINLTITVFIFWSKATHNRVIGKTRTNLKAEFESVTCHSTVMNSLLFPQWILG